MVDIKENLTYLTGKNQIELAELFDVSASAMYQRNGLHTWRVDMIEAAANMLGIAPDRIIDTNRFDSKYIPMAHGDLMRSIASKLEPQTTEILWRNHITPRNYRSYWVQGYGNPTLLNVLRMAKIHNMSLAEMCRVDDQA